MNVDRNGRSGSGRNKGLKKKHRKDAPPSFRSTEAALLPGSAALPVIREEPADAIPESGPEPVTPAASDAGSAAVPPSSSLTAEAVPAETEEPQDEKPIEPTLIAYFGTDPVKPSAFLKALRDAKVSRFSGSDTSAVEALVAENDKDGSRLWQLVVNASASDAVSAWIWPFIQNRVNRIVGVQVDLRQQSAPQILRFVTTALSGSLDAEDKERGRRAENDLRLAVAWLIEKRSMEPADVAEQLRHLHVDTSRDTERRVRKSLASGSKIEFQASIAALCLSDDQLRRTRQERDFERNERFDLMGSLEALRQQAEGHARTIASLEAEKAELMRLLDEERIKSESDRRHHAHSSTQTQADFSTSLQRVKGLVEDAGDAVRIAMKRAEEGSLKGLQAAERRIISAVDAITEIGR